MQGHDSLQVLRQMRTPGGQTLGISHVFQRMRGSDVVYVGQTVAGECLSVGADATHADACKNRGKTISVSVKAGRFTK